MKLLKTLLILFVPVMWAADPFVVSLFPSNDQTVADATQATGLRVVNQASLAVNQLDGFSVNPRIAVRFSGPVNTDTVRSTIFLTPADRPFDVIPINQVSYDPQTFTVYAKPDRVLDQQRQYRLFVAGATGTIASTTFTTLSVSTWLERARADLPQTPSSLSIAATYKFSDLLNFTLHQQTHVNPTQFSDTSLPINLIGGVGSITFGTFRSPAYLNAQQMIDNIPTAQDPGPGLAANQIYFHALLPVTPKPAAGYPVVIFGHGLGDTQYGGSSAMALTLAPAGFAIVAINAVGHGYGPLSTVMLRLKNGQQVELPSGGRSIADADGTIQPYGGCILTNGGFGIRDCLRQTSIDLMQLVRTIKSGVDLDGDGSVDLDPNRIYYLGQSLGAMYGTLLTAVEPDLPVVTLNAGGGSAIDIARLSPSFLPLLEKGLGLGSNFSDQYVLRDQPVQILDVPGAVALDDALEQLDWANMPGDPLAFAPLLRASQLQGVPGKRVLFQFATGDETVPNPTESALVRAAGMRQSTWIFRNDRARAAFPSLPANPHSYLTNLFSGAPALSIALSTQTQIAGFFTSNGTTIPDPNAGGLNFFEMPAVLPETLGFQ